MQSSKNDILTNNLQCNTTYVQRGECITDCSLAVSMIQLSLYDFLNVTTNVFRHH